MLKDKIVNIDYSRVLKPQEDGYDIQVFKEIKKNNGFVHIDYPPSMVKLHGHVAFLPKSKEDLDTLQKINFEPLADLFNHVYPIGYQNLCQLVDVCVPDFENKGISGQYDGVDFNHPHAWGVMTTLYYNPSATMANLMHELMHWKLVSLGFGTKANTFFPTTDEFILNDESELCWSIVNSYADTAQPAVGNKPTDRPVSASLHAYVSFLAVTHVHISFLKKGYLSEESLAKIQLWGSRFDRCLNELWKVGKFTNKGMRLMMGVTEWTNDFYKELDTIKHLL